MTHASQRALGSARGRRDGPRDLDPYQSKGKLPLATCGGCGAAHRQGRWRWEEAPATAAVVVCPACQRLRDGVPAHTVELTGEFHDCWDQVRHLLQHVERQEQREHPLERVMAVRITAAKAVVPTTGVHIARRLTAALVRAFRHRVRAGHGRDLTVLDFAAAAAAEA